MANKYAVVADLSQCIKLLKSAVCTATDATISMETSANTALWPCNATFISNTGDQNNNSQHGRGGPKLLNGIFRENGLYSKGLPEDHSHKESLAAQKHYDDNDETPTDDPDNRKPPSDAKTNLDDGKQKDDQIGL